MVPYTGFVNLHLDYIYILVKVKRIFWVDPEDFTGTLKGDTNETEKINKSTS